MTATLYGLIGVIAFRGLGGVSGRAAMAVCASFIATVAISRVYLGAHWPSDVAAGVLFGTGMTAGFALVFRRDAVSRQTAAAFLAACAAALALIGTWHIERDFAKGLAFYARQPQAPIVLARAWRDSGWLELPAYRIDVGGEREEPLVLQWRGTAAALVEDLSRLGWSAPPQWSLATINRFAYPHQDAAALPVTPKFHDGRREVVAMMRPAALGSIQGRYVLRAWPRRVEEPGGKVDDVLLASIAFERIAHPMNELSVPLAVNDVPCDAGPLLAGLTRALPVGELLKAIDGGCGARPVLAGG
jgi:undecaprenyl-diphosphatase